MTAWLVETLVSMTVLMAIVLLLRQPVAQLFGAQAAYALWLAPFVRLIVPPLPESVAENTVVIHYDVALVAAAAPPVPVEPSLQQMLLIAWAAGALLFLLFQCLVHYRFVRTALDGALTLRSVRGPELMESTSVEGPIAVGLFRRRIILPVDFAARVTPEQRELALAHEHLHHRRNDLLALAAATVVLAVHWFNPLAHAAYRAFRADLESACDAQLARNLTGKQRAAYAEALVRCAAAPVPRVICTLTTIGELKGRLKMLKFNHGRLARLSGTAVAMVLTAAGIAVTAQAQASPQPHTVLAVPVVGKAPAGAPTPLRLVPVESASPTLPEAATSFVLRDGAAHAQSGKPAEVESSKVTHFAFRDGAFHAAAGKPPIVSTQSVVVNDAAAEIPTGNPNVTVSQTCSGKKFQASASGTSKDSSSHSTISICADANKSDREFAALLEQSLSKIEKGEQLNGPGKDQIIAQLRARIAELRSK